MRRELKRVGYVRFLDVLGYRLYHRLVVRAGDVACEARFLSRLASAYPAVPAGLPVLTSTTPNSAEARAFLEKVRPELMIARPPGVAILRRPAYPVAEFELDTQQTDHPSSPALKRGLLVATLELHEAYLGIAVDWSTVVPALIEHFAAGMTLRIRSDPRRLSLGLRIYPRESSYLHRAFVRPLVVECVGGVGRFRYA